ncbi:MULTISPECIES: PTS sugar transporter subunit IIA [Enterococcus]|uniref:PTS sugar transporter subunit IIA n=1 Tax=Enterococcus TaxID=1350 RepID=UPI00065E563B|nr:MULTISPECIES: PTS sugar transporter subunit IIA [Enterococcus]KAF1302797.1 hypothetical protein BAU16_05885 [Enterococcus sp. JM9B]
MIGCILTGHGSFAPGLSGAAQMITGPQENLDLIPFEAEMDPKLFEQNLQKSIEKCVENCKEVIVFTDLLGGTPFKTAMLLTQHMKNVEVIAGTNLPILLEFLGSRIFQESSEQLIPQLVETGKQGIIHMQLNHEEESEIDENGI